MHNKQIEEVLERFDERFKDLKWQDLPIHGSTLNELRAFLKSELTSLISQVQQAERERIKSKVGFLRQWINERSKIYLITNSDIEYWLELTQKAP